MSAVQVLHEERPGIVSGIVRHKLTQSLRRLGLFFKRVVATRVQTQVLGGQWAIFGDGFVDGRTSMSIQTDLTNSGSVINEQFFVDGDQNSLLYFYVCDNVAFIDNITFHPVPEPSTFGLLAVVFSALLVARRWIA